MNVSNNIDTIKAAYDAMSSAANAVAGLGDLPKNQYSVKAQDMGAGRYDSLQLSEEYKKAIASGYAEDWQTNPEYDSASVLMGIMDGSGDGLTALPEATINEKIISFVHDANIAMTEIQMKMIDDTIAGLKNTNIHNRPADYFET